MSSHSIFNRLKRFILQNARKTFISIKNNNRQVENEISNLWYFFEDHLSFPKISNPFILNPVPGLFFENINCYEHGAESVFVFQHCGKTNNRL